MSKESFFSVVIPTRNRAHLLSGALQSALQQDFDDYEIVVSDNCSQDNTAQVVKDLQTSRVSYVRVDRPLPMPDHWEFALDQARGQYVTFLSDDDALTSQALRRVAETIASHKTKLVGLYSANYYGANWYDTACRNVAILNPYSGKELECDSHTTLNNIFKCRVLYQAPRMINSFCHRETMLRVRAEVKRIFLLSPDYSFAAFILAELPTWIYLDEPLHIQGVFPEGIGSTQVYNRGESAREYVREFNQTRLMERVPLDVSVVTNYIAETLLMCKERMASKLADYEIDQPEYFSSCWQDIMLYETNGVDVDADKKEFLRVLAQQPQDVEQAVRAIISPPAPVPSEPALERPAFQSPVKRLARRVINRSTTLTNFESLIRKRAVDSESLTESNPVPKTIVLRGEEAGFHNILECTEQLARLIETANQQAEPSRTSNTLSLSGQ